MQGMFNAKPDLVIIVDNVLLTFEAKFPEPFNPQHLQRTRNISEVCATLLYNDLGIKEPPEYSVVKLGARDSPDIGWDDILEIARSTYPEDDRAVIALTSELNLLKKRG